MAQKFFYVVDHFVPFPSSEYGGIWNVVAENDEECFDLIAESVDGFYETNYGTLRENIMKAVTFKLAEDVESAVIEEFTT
ncbi:MAG: hypothetical protein CBD74_07790 [Saprospirales bacterium TMED214]|nr:MAG: hypothetical protein CBD74_07790 [Saprospirales bacterium TMED214]